MKVPSNHFHILLLLLPAPHTNYHTYSRESPTPTAQNDEEHREYRRIHRHGRTLRRHGVHRPIAGPPVVIASATPRGTVAPIRYQQNIFQGRVRSVVRRRSVVGRRGTDANGVRRGGLPGQDEEHRRAAHEAEEGDASSRERQECDIPGRIRDRHRRG